MNHCNLFKQTQNGVLGCFEKITHFIFDYKLTALLYIRHGNMSLVRGCIWCVAFESNLEEATTEMPKCHQCINCPPWWMKPKVSVSLLGEKEFTPLATKHAIYQTVPESNLDLIPSPHVRTWQKGPSPPCDNCTLSLSHCSGSC